jgi:hypothetical protein
MSNAADLVRQIRITQAWALLGGGTITRGRSKAFWRDGDGLSIQLDDDRGGWYDHKDNVGGGVLDLIVHVNRGTRSDAARWLSDATGIGLDDRKPDPEARAQRLDIERNLPIARIWKRFLLSVLDELLTQLKTALFDSTQQLPGIDEISNIERLAADIRGADNALLVEVFREWWLLWPSTTEALVALGRRREQAEQRALKRFIEQLGRERSHHAAA